MSETPRRTRPRWWRWQFSLRALLIATTLAAAGTYWGFARYRASAPQERKLADGSIIWCEQRWSDAARTQSVRHGRWLIYDRHGRVLCRGRYDNGSAAGSWTYFHANGGVALRGACHDDCWTGDWSQWDDNGTKILAARFGNPQREETPPRWYAHVGTALGAWRPAPPTLRKFSLVEGEVRRWGKDGLPISQAPVATASGSGKSVDPLAELARQLALHQIEPTSQKAAFDLLAAHYHRSAPGEQEQILASLAGIGTPLLPHLSHALHSGDPNFRHFAVAVYARMLPPRRRRDGSRYPEVGLRAAAKDVLAPAVGHSDPLVAEAAAILVNHSLYEF